MKDTFQLLQEIKQSKTFTEGFNTSIEGCRCERCVISRYRHTSEPERMDPGHSFWDYMRYCISQVKNEGLWLEFGVGMGSTIDFISKNNNSKSIIGFDSFEGLPEDWKMSDSLTYAKGRYSLNGTLPPVKNKNIEFITGYFSDTLPYFLQKQDAPCAFVHMDCDLYSSTLYVLDTLNKFDKLVKGTVILFDELYNYQYFDRHEFKAFKEFFATSGLKYSWLAHTESPVVWNGNQAALVIEG
jgi:hypothetical protein